MIPHPCYYYAGDQVRPLDLDRRDPGRDLEAKLRGLPSLTLHRILETGPTARDRVNPPALLRAVARELVRRHMDGLEFEDTLRRARETGAAVRLGRRWVP